jgi:hypothetical protein
MRDFTTAGVHPFPPTKTMTRKLILFYLLTCSFACGSGTPAPVNSPAGSPAAGNGAAPAPMFAEAVGTPTPAPSKPSDSPRTVRDHFALLPDEYFLLEGCERASDPNCDRARAEYLKTFLEVEDVRNGYLKAGCDGAQSCLTMALFKRPDSTYLVAVNTTHEMMDDYHFLEYSGGTWRDVSAGVVPEYDRRKMYELPRYGTTVRVFAKKIVEETDDYMISSKGRFLYDLDWRDGRFVKK